MSDVRGGHRLTLELRGGHHLMQEQHKAIVVPGAAGRGNPGKWWRLWWSANLQQSPRCPRCQLKKTSHAGSYVHIIYVTFCGRINSAGNQYKNELPSCYTAQRVLICFGVEVLRYIPTTFSGLSKWQRLKTVIKWNWSSGFQSVTSFDRMTNNSGRSSPQRSARGSTLSALGMVLWTVLVNGRELSTDGREQSTDVCEQILAPNRAGRGPNCYFGDTKYVNHAQIRYIH